MDLSQPERELLGQAPDHWVPLGRVARFVDGVLKLRDMGLVKTRMVPLPTKAGHAQMEWQVTRKGRRVTAAF